MLALKLFLVPGFLLLLSLVGRRFGPTIAGWLAGLPVITGPILFVLALEQGGEFVSRAAASSTAGVVALVCYMVVYARLAQRASWRIAAPMALSAWLVMAAATTRYVNELWMSMALAGTALLAAPRCFPPPRALAPTMRAAVPELLMRMAFGASLTLFVSFIANALGSAWSGVFATFPVLATVLAVTTHRGEGGGSVNALLTAMARGLLASASFCASLSFALTTLPLGTAFCVAMAVGMCAQVATRGTIARKAEMRT